MYHTRDGMLSLFHIHSNRTESETFKIVENKTGMCLKSKQFNLHNGFDA